MTDIVAMVNELKSVVEWQNIPIRQTASEMNADLTDMIVRSIRGFFIQSGRYKQYTPDMLVYDENDTSLVVGINYDLDADEYEYVIRCAEEMFFQKLGTTINTIVGYTTDAMTITNADKPYANVADRINSIKEEKRRLWYTMVRHNSL